MTESVTKVSYSNRFSKQLKKAPTKIKEAFLRRRELFLQNNSNRLLNNHSLTGEFLGYRSFNITGDWRAIFRQHFDDQGAIVITFEILGTHSQLYK